MIKDRGNIKWTSMMLPEHVEQLKELVREDQKTQKPILDEQQLSSMNTLIQESVNEKFSIGLVFYQNGMRKEVEGLIHQVDYLNKKIKFKTKEDKFELNIEDICSVYKIERSS